MKWEKMSTWNYKMFVRMPYSGQALPDKWVEVVRLRYFEMANPSGWGAWVNDTPEAYLGNWVRVHLDHVTLEEAKRLAEAEYLLTK